MKKEMFTCATIEAVVYNLKEAGARGISAEGFKSFIKKSKRGWVILGKFNMMPNCRSGYRVIATPKSVINLLLKEGCIDYKEEGKYTVITVKNFRDDHHFLKEVGMI